MRTEVAQTHDPVCSRAASGLPDHGRSGVVADVGFEGGRVGNNFFISLKCIFWRTDAMAQFANAFIQQLKFKFLVRSQKAETLDCLLAVVDDQGCVIPSIQSNFFRFFVY